MLSQLLIVFTLSTTCILLLWMFKVTKFIKYIGPILSTVPVVYLLFSSRSLDISIVTITTLTILLMCSISLELVDYRFTPAHTLIYLALSLLIGLVLIMRGLVVIACIWLMFTTFFAPLLARSRSRTSISSCVKYIVFSAIGSTLLMLGLSFLEILNRELLVIPILLVIFGIAYELGIIPLHVWIPDVYRNSDRESVALLSSFMKIAAVISLCKILSIIDPTPQYDIFLALASISIITILVGNLGALFSREIEHVLAFSSIAQTGYGIAILSIAFLRHDMFIKCLGIFMFHIISVAISKCALFLGLDYTNRKNIRTPILLHVLSLIGIPPLIGFWPKLFIVMYMLESGQIWLAIFIIINFAIAVPYYIRIFRDYKTYNLSKLIIFPVIVLTCMLIVLGIFFPVEMLSGCMKIVGL